MVFLTDSSSSLRAASYVGLSFVCSCSLGTETGKEGELHTRASFARKGESETDLYVDLDQEGTRYGY